MDAKPPPEAVHMELLRIGASPEFRAAPKLRDFLQYVTNEALAGRAAQIKEYAVGTVVYGKGASYDPRLDSTVRVEAAKLRSRLAQYYERSGKDDPLRISVPKGGYSPRFEETPTRPADAIGESAREFPSIAVLPFRNLSPDPENEYFSDGLLEELTAALTRSNVMRVAPRIAALRYKGVLPDLTEVRQTLNVDRVLEGSIRREHQRLRVTVQLVDIASSRELWSESYDRAVRDAFAIQHEIAQRVVSVIRGGDSSRILIHSHAPKPESFDLYLRALHRVQRWETATELEGLDLFERAVAADPEYPLPYVGIARSLMCLGVMGFRAPVELLPKAHSALETALVLDPALADAHVVRATILARHEWDWDGAEREYRTAIQLAPGLAQAHNDYAIELLAPNGRYEEAYAEWRRARELDPFSPAIAYGHGWMLLYRRRFVESAREFHELLASGAIFEAERVGLAIALLGQGKYRESVQEHAKIERHHPSLSSACLHTVLLALAGETNAAWIRLRELEMRAQSSYVPASLLAWIHFALGQRDTGFQLLERAYVGKEPALRSMKEGFDWDPIRSDPRFRVMLGRLWPEQ